MLYTSNRKDVKRMSTGKSLLIISGILIIGALILEVTGICWKC